MSLAGALQPLAIGLLLVATLALGVWALRTARALRSLTRRISAGEPGVRSRLEEHGQDLRGLGAAVEQLGASRDGALRELAAHRDLLDAVLETMQEGVLVLDASGRIDHVNPALREMLLLRDDPRGRVLLEAVRNSELQAVLGRAREQGAAASAEVEVAGLKPRRLLVRAAPLRPAPGGLVAVVVDVTELRRLESLRRDFVANVSHELRTPVAAVRSAAETLQSGALGDPVAAGRFLAMIDRNADRMQHLVDDLLDLARIESRQLKLRPEPVDLAEAAEQALGSFRARAEQRRLALLLEVPAGLRVQADLRALEQVLGNLVENAVKYCPEGSRVTVRARPAAPEREHVRIEVEDQGPGIEPRHLPRLFERFYRVDAGRSRELGGTGLGLSIVKHLVEAMGGTVGVQSVPGAGSTFWLELRRP